jgi:hypothetical protein
MNSNQATKLTKILSDTKKNKHKELIETITDNGQFLELFNESDMDHFAFEKALSEHFQSIEVPSTLKGSIMSSIKERLADNKQYKTQ